MEEAPSDGEIKARTKDTILNDNVAQEATELDIDRRRFEIANEKVLKVFISLGIVALQKKNGDYVLSKVKFTLSCIFWTVFPLIFISLVFTTSHHINGSYQDTDPEYCNYSSPETIFFDRTKLMIWFFSFSAIQTISLASINSCLSRLLEEISTLSRFQGSFTIPLKVEIIGRGPRDRFIAEGKDCTVFFLLPGIMMFLSHLSLAVWWLICFLQFMNRHYFQCEWPYILTHFVTSIQPFLTNNFLIFLCKWLLGIYEELLKYMIATSSQWEKPQIRLLRQYLTKLQEIFTYMNNGFFKVTIGINYVNACAGAIASLFNILQGVNQVVYIIPLFWHLYFITSPCKYGLLLMNK
ncbi:hypothetical protein SK128_027327, partial [Halocaridina rubra]